MAKNKNAGKPRNYALECGVYRFGKGKMYHKKAIYKFNKKKAAVKAPTPNPTFVEKPVKGAKNGETRMVRVKRLRNDVPTQEPAKAGTSVNFFSKHKRSLRPSLTPGKICILLAGAHKGKRVVVLKQLASGLVLINGPLKLNGCPMRRVNQNYLLATGTSVDVSAVTLPENVNDDYFRHAKPEKVKKADGDIFTSKKYEDLCPTSHSMDVPFVKRTEYQLCNADGDTGEVSLLLDNGETKDDLNLPTFKAIGEPTDEDKKLSEEILKAQDAGHDIQVIVLAACGQEKIIGHKITEVK